MMFQVPLLRRTKLTVENDQVSTAIFSKFTDFLHFPLSDQVAGILLPQLYHYTVYRCDSHSVDEIV